MLGNKATYSTGAITPEILYKMARYANPKDF